MGVVEIVGRADGDIVDTVRGAPAELFQVSVEPLDLGEVSDVEGVPVENANGIVRIDRGDESVAGRLDRLKTPRGSLGRMYDIAERSTR